MFAEWFAHPEFEGCSFGSARIEVSDRDHPVHQAAVSHLADIRGYIESLMAAHEGGTAATVRAREVAELLPGEHGS